MIAVADHGTRRKIASGLSERALATTSARSRSRLARRSLYGVAAATGVMKRQPTMLTPRCHGS
jgi:hypothetical protein